MDLFANVRVEQVEPVIALALPRLDRLGCTLRQHETVFVSLLHLASGEGLVHLAQLVHLREAERENGVGGMWEW